MKILIIEDNPRLIVKLGGSLKKWFVVEIVNTGEKGLKLAQTQHFDLILLDLNLPDIHGLQVCSKIRETNTDVPILILTGDLTNSSQVELLNAGADNYITKPLNIDNLRAHINSLARRRKRSEHELAIMVGDLCVDPTRRTVSRAGTPITLRRKEFDILEYLAKNPGRILSRQNIIDHAWSSTSAGWTGSVDVHIKKLRDAIDKPFGVNSVKTTYGVGYTLEAAFVPSESLATETLV